MYAISRSEIMREFGTRWVSEIRLDGKEGFRELAQYGNRHAVFDMGAETGYVHWDQYNAITQPISHGAKYLHEKTGINEGLLRGAGYVLALFGAYKLGKYFYDNF